MNNQVSSYRQIIKVTSLFGGVEVFNILIAIIRSKFIAILLGPSGMGIAGLFNSTITLITGLTNFGLSKSAVKDVASANSSRNIERISTVVIVLRRLVWITGLLGSLITIVLAKQLSEITFGNNNYTIAFVWLSITLLINQLSSGQLVVLRGMQKLKYLAKANLTGNILGLIITIPLYYYLGIDGIVPGMIISSFASLARSWFYSSKIKIDTIVVDFGTTLNEGKKMLLMGFMISLSGLLSLGASYLVRIFISNIGGIEQVGLYTAGFTIINTYVGLIFSAMGTDYYPRLSSVSSDNEKCKVTINQQAEIAILIISPIISFFIIFSNIIIILLYSDRFSLINDMILWASLGMILKAGSWSMGFIFLAKGDSKLFLFNESLSIIYIFLFNILGYYIYGLTGLGVSFLISYFFHFIQMSIISSKIYRINFNSTVIIIICIQFIIAIICLCIVKYIPSPINYLLGSLLAMGATSYSLYNLNNRLNIRSFIKNYINKKSNIK